jgi:hypothetical protein
MDEQDKQANQVNQTKQANKMLDYASTNQALDCGCKVPISGEINKMTETAQIKLAQAEHSKELQDLNRRIYSLEQVVNRFNSIFENIINEEIRRRLFLFDAKNTLDIGGPGNLAAPYPKY